MNNIVDTTIQSAAQSKVSMCKFITPNDVGATGGHQAGFHIHKNASKVFFDSEGQKGSNKDKQIKIKWQNDFETTSRAIYYGIKTRNEYRLTRFGRNFPFLTDDHIGDLLVISKQEDEYYEAFVLSTDSEIEKFLDTFGMSPVDTNGLVQIPNSINNTNNLDELLAQKAKTFESFPTSKVVAELARSLFNKCNSINEKYIKTNPDKIILDWIKSEYKFFLTLENQLCVDILQTRFDNTENFIKAANSIANRRKSRAGKSLELHLEEIFKSRNLQFESQVCTEGKKRPDFIFPGAKEYHNMNFPTSSLIFLASKTTCKDRWRQILNEADRIEVKHLFTLQQGISNNQLTEMYENGIKLVVPKEYINTFPREFRDKIEPLNGFINFVEKIQSR